MQVMIETQELCKQYGNVMAVNKLNLCIIKGELFCFLGPNGAGKTTTLKLMTGLLRPTSGSVQINGMDVHANSDEVKRIIGYIPDLPYLYERITPHEFMMFTAELYRIDDKTARDRETQLFDTLGLHSVANVMIKDISHGMKQRLLYASTLLHNPSVLFIDEPLVGLDPRSIRTIKNLLKEQTTSGVTVFLTTHILALAEEIADRIGIIHQGELTALGTTEELLKMKPEAKSLEDVFLQITGM